MIKPEEIKKLVTGKPIKVRKLKLPFDYIPAFKIVIGPSKLPKVKA